MMSCGFGKLVAQSHAVRFKDRAVQAKHIDTDSPVNSPGFSNFHIDPEGYVWETINSGVVKIDSRTGRS